MSRTPEQIADAIVSAMDIDHRAIGDITDDDVYQAALLAAREAQTPIDFKPGDEFNYYRQQWQYLTGALDDSLRLRITGSDGTATKHLTISPDQARRILAMLSTESETN